MPLTPSEALVARLCRRSFLSLWSEPNPRAGPGKELCDLIVVCAPDVVIFSVKEIALGDSGDSQVDGNRWRRRAIDDSVKQLYGAGRRVRAGGNVVRADGSLGLPLPQLELIRTHHVAVALGSAGAVPYEQGDFGRGFVHVFDEESLECVLGELDTVTDFVAYLTAKEALLASGSVPLLSGGEKDLLAVYLHRGRSFPSGAGLLVIEPGAWTALTTKAEWGRRKHADRESYVWDYLIETLTSLTGVPGSLGRELLDEREAILRVMAREDRFARRMLASAFNEFMRHAAAGKTRARITRSPNGAVYVFLAGARDEDRDHRSRELQLRCFVARGLAADGKLSLPGHPENDTPRRDVDHPTVESAHAPSARDAERDAPLVIGIATERYEGRPGFSLDAVYVKIPRWTDEEQRKMEGIQADLGYFRAPLIEHEHVEEYPPDAFTA